MDSPNTPFLSITDDDDENSETNDKIYEDSPLNSPNPKHRRHVLVTIFHLTTYLLALWGLIAIPLLTHSSILSHPSSSTSTSSSSQKHPNPLQFSDPIHHHPNNGNNNNNNLGSEVIADVYRPSTLPPGLNLCSCGTSIPDALALGYVYDTLAAAWMPPHCREDTLTAEFDRAGPGKGGEWAYYGDSKGEREIGKSGLAGLDVGGRFWYIFLSFFLFCFSFSFSCSFPWF